MRRGDFAAAHAVSDAVLTMPAPDPVVTPRHQQRVWNGQPVDGRSVLVHCFHGLGDTIQFARFLPPLARRAREVHVWAPAALLPLLASVCMPRGRPLCLHALHDGAPPVSCDVHVEIMELLHVLRVGDHDLPGAVPYLQVSAPPPMRPPDDRRTVGVVWAVGTWAPERTIPTELLCPLLRLSRIRWHSLQHAPAAGAPIRSLPAFPVRTHGDICETAREMLALDLIVSVDSMPAHLAGALACPVWTLLPHRADWRWMDGRDASPWYPTMRLLRQPHPGDWASVIARLGDDLEVWSEQARH